MASFMKKLSIWLLVFTMVFTQTPMYHVHAEDTDTGHTHDTSEVVEDEESQDSSVAHVQEHIDSLLISYLGTTEMSLADIQEAVEAMDWDTVRMAQYEIYELSQEDAVLELSDEDAKTLEENNETFIDFCNVLNEKAEGNPYSTSLLASDSFTVSDGQISVAYSGSSTADTGSKVSETSCKFEAWASGGYRGSTNTITLTNNSGNKAVISFDYSVTGDCSACSLGTTSGSGSYTSAELENGGTITITLTGKGGLFSGDEPVLTLSNIKLTLVEDDPQVTFNFDSSIGSVTVGGAAITSGTIKEVDKTEGATLVATTLSNSIFYGWTDGEGKILSTDATFTLNPSSSMTVKAIFGKKIITVFIKLVQVIFSMI